MTHSAAAKLLVSIGLALLGNGIAAISIGEHYSMMAGVWVVIACGGTFGIWKLRKLIVDLRWIAAAVRPKSRNFR